MRMRPSVFCSQARRRGGGPDHDSDGPTTFSYDALGRRTSLTRPNGNQTTATYDAASQLTELAHALGATTLSRFACTYL